MKIFKILTLSTVVLLFFNINVCSQRLTCNSQDLAREILMTDKMSQKGAYINHIDISNNLKSGTETIVR